MGIKLVYILILITSLFSYHTFGAEAVDDKIANCVKTSIPMNSLKATKNCAGFNYTFLKEEKTITKDNANEYLCAALYNSTLKVCSNSQLSNAANTIFNNQTIFDKKISEYMKLYIYSVCGEWIKISTYKNGETNKFVDKINALFISSPVICPSVCFDSKNNVTNPLCTVIPLIVEEIKAIQASPQSTDATKNIKQVTEKSSGNNQDKTVAVSTTKKTVNDKNTINVTPDENHVTKVSNDAKTPALSVVQKTEPQKTEPQKVANSPSSGADTTEKKNEEPKNVPSAPASKTTTLSDGDILPDNINEENNNVVMSVDDPNDDIDDNNDVVESPNVINGPADIVPPSLEKEDDAHFFGIFTILGFIGIAGCLAYHHKQKILAILLEGRRSRGGRGRRRPSTASYRKLDCTLEEAVTSQCNANVTHVIY